MVSDGPESGAESLWRRTGSGWERIWRARAKRTLWGDEEAPLAAARRPETARRPRRPRIVESRARVGDWCWAEERAEAESTTVALG